MPIVQQSMSTFSSVFLGEAQQILSALDVSPVEQMARGLAEVRDGGGRLFILGVGGSAGHAGHAVNDFRKLCGFEAYAPTDNVSELTARINDDGWETACGMAARLAPRAEDAVLVFSVGGGNREKKVSVNLVRALETARGAGARIFGIVGRDGGFTRDSRRSLRGGADRGERGPRHSAYRRDVRGDLASAGEPPGCCSERHQVGIAAMIGRARWFIAGGAGFIGSHFTDRLLRRPASTRGHALRNFSSGREWHYAQHAADRRLRVVRGDVKDTDRAAGGAWPSHDVVIHLASNPDIARAATEPDIDFREGTLLTQQVVEAMRVTGAPRIALCLGQRRIRRPGR